MRDQNIFPKHYKKCIISNTQTKQFWCERCQKAINQIYIYKGSMFCPCCVTDKIKKECQIVDQNGNKL